MKISLLIAWLGCYAWASTPPWEPTIRLKENQITASPSDQHKPTYMKIEVWDQIKCQVNLEGDRSLRISDQCQLLRGAFRYRYRQSHLDTELIQVFAVTQKAGTSTILVEQPLEVVAPPAG